MNERRSAVVPDPLAEDIRTVHRLSMAIPVLRA